MNKEIKIFTLVTVWGRPVFWWQLLEIIDLKQCSQVPNIEHIETWQNARKIKIWDDYIEKESLHIPNNSHILLNRVPWHMGTWNNASSLYSLERIELEQHIYNQTRQGYSIYVNRNKYWHIVIQEWDYIHIYL